MTKVTPELLERLRAEAEQTEEMYVEVETDVLIELIDQAERPRDRDSYLS